MHNNTGIVYLTKDAELIAKTNPKIDRIIVFSPDCYEILKVKYKNIVKPSIYFSPTKITERLIHYEKKVRNILKDNNLIEKDYVEETFIFQLINILSSIEYINLSITNENTKYWTLVNKNKIIKTNNKNEILLIIVKNIIENQIGQFKITKDSKQKFKWILKLINFLIFKYAKKNKIWFTGNNYGFPNIAKNIYENDKDCSIFYLFSDKKYIIIKSIISLFKILRGKKDIIGIEPVIEEKRVYRNNIDIILDLTLDNELLKIKKIISKYLSEICDYTNNIYNYLDEIVFKTKPKLLIAHHLYFMEAVTLGSIFNKYNKSCYILSHGSHRNSDNEFCSFELKRHANGLLYSKFASHIFVQNLGGENLLKSISDNNKLLLNNKKIINTKPIMWGKKINDSKINIKKEFIFLHASTFKPLSARNLIYENSFEYFDNIINLSKAFDKLSNTKLIILAKNLSECSHLTLKKNIKKYKNVFIKSSGTGDRESFIDYLKKADCLISYSSTTIEEAIYNNIPVGIINFSGNNHINFCPKKDIADNNGIYELNSIDLIGKLKLIMKNHKNNKLKNEIVEYYFDKSNIIDVKFFSKNLLNF